MERQRFMVAAGTLATAALSAAVPGVAQAQGQRGSNENIRQTRSHIAGIIDDLKFDPGVYAGHRQAAIDALDAAHQELTAALDFRNKAVRNVALANADIQGEIDWLDGAIANLEGDAADYGGHKEKAIQRLRDARRELRAALTM
jgi:hypothetical protein